MKLVVKSTRIIIVAVRRASVVIMLYSWFLGFLIGWRFSRLFSNSQGKSKNQSSLSRALAHLSGTCSYLEIWLVHLMVCTHCDWLFQLLLVSRFTLTQSAYFLLAPHLMTYKKIHRPDINTLWSFVAERKQQFHFSLFFCFLSPLPKSPPNRQRNKVVCLANELLFSSLYAHVT